MFRGMSYTVTKDRGIDSCKGNDEQREGREDGRWNVSPRRWITIEWVVAVRARSSRIAGLNEFV